MGNESFDLREQGLEPFKQGATAGVTDAQPKDDRTSLALAHTVWKILIFGNDDGLMRDGVSPDLGIVCIPKA